MNIPKQRILIIGGSSGIGLASAQLAVEQNYEVIIASRSQQKLLAAKQFMDTAAITTTTVDITQQESILSCFKQIGQIDHLVLAGSEICFGDIQSLSLQQAQQSFDSKFFGPYRVIKTSLDYINPKGSITLFSGSSSRKVQKGSEVMSAINGAVEGLSQGLSVSLSPIRVNCIAPGLIDTPAYNVLDNELRQAMYDSFTQDLPIKRAGHADEVAQSVLYLINNHYTTGTILHVDGGHAVS